MRVNSGFIFCCLVAISFWATAFEAVAQKKAKPSAQAVKFVKTATGIYDSQKSLEELGIDTVSNPQLRRQMILCYPVWEADAGADRWMYFGWFRPSDTENALEEVFLRIYEQEGKLWADWYEMPERERENFSREWLKEQPFGKLQPSDLLDGGNIFSTCAVVADKNGFVMKAKARGEFKVATPAAYKYMLVDMGFYTDRYTSGSQFIGADGSTVVIAHEHKFPLFKISKKYKKF